LSNLVIIKVQLISPFLMEIFNQGYRANDFKPIN
jgi:hypothetical protein